MILLYIFFQKLQFMIFWIKRISTTLFRQKNPIYIIKIMHVCWFFITTMYDTCIFYLITSMSFRISSIFQMCFRRTKTLNNLSDQRYKVFCNFVTLPSSIVFNLLQPNLYICEQSDDYRLISQSRESLAAICVWFKKVARFDLFKIFSNNKNTLVPRK